VLQQSADFPIAEHATLKALSVMRKHVERMRIARRDQLQNPHFRRTKSGCAPGKFFKQLHDASPELRQDA
jgi:hypothetical protein